MAAAPLCAYIMDRRYDYPALLAVCDIKLRSDVEPSYLNIYVGVRGRRRYLKTCLRYLESAISTAGVDVRVVIVEQDDTPHHFDIAEKHGFDYVFIPMSESNSRGLYSRALVYNVGFLAAGPAKWHVFHDCDLLVAADFFLKMRIHLDASPKWLQPYADQHVIKLGPGASEAIMNSTDLFDLARIDDLVPTGRGAPGGTIVVRGDVFREVGGYDPELFYGYAPEDSMFWTKLELQNLRLDAIDRCHQGSAAYAENPRIDVYHLHHPMADAGNPELQNMEMLQRVFWQMPYEEKNKVVELKRRLLAGEPCE